ncbi:MAG: AIR synthase-related protein [Myxococcota bacterium]
MTEWMPVGKLDPRLLAELLHTAPLDASVVVGPGPGRDVAVVDAGGEGYLLLTADPITFATEEIGLYAVTVNVNDIATAGGVPRWLLATVLLPEHGTGEDFARDVQQQLETACREHSIALVGGHTEVTRGLNRPLVLGALVGEVPRDALVRSDGGRPEDAVLLTRGAALEGSCILAREHRDALRQADFAAEFLERCAGFMRSPGLCVLPAARAFARATRVHTMHDPTEGGIATALWELAESSSLALRVDAAAIPVLAETRRLCSHFGLDPLGLIASGALLALVEAADAQAAIASCEDAGIPCARIGRAEAADLSGPRVLDSGTGRPLPRFTQDEIARVPESGDRHLGRGR